MRKILYVAACAGFVACSLDDSVALVGPGEPGGADASLGDASSSLDSGSSSDGSSIRDAEPDAPVVIGDSGPTKYERTITIQSSKVQANLTDFPVWIDIADANLATHAAVDGSNIFFTSADGGALAFERQSYDSASGHLSAWVKVPALSATANTSILVRYGGWPSVSAPSSAAVFASGFVAVWHLESPSGSTFPEALGAHAGTATGLSGASSVAATLGKGVAFDGGAGEITFTNPLSGNTAHTISLWVEQGTTADNDALVVLGNGATDQSRWFHSAFNNPANNPTKIAVGFYGDDWVNPNVDIEAAGFKLLDWVYDGAGNSDIYENGVHVAGPYAATGNPNTQGAGGYLGNAPAAWGQNMGAHAVLDEVRIANVTRTAQWIGTEFANQSSASTFYAAGPERIVP